MTNFHQINKVGLISLLYVFSELIFSPIGRCAADPKDVNPDDINPEVVKPIEALNDELRSEQRLIITNRKSPLAGLAPTTQSTFKINPEKLPKMANSLTELIEGTPGVAENSQPGLFQVVSIRGVSRQRILTLMDGVRLSSERRAGTSASFIDPSLLQGVSITRGPASTYYGSGAMGGVIQLDLKRVLGSEFSSGLGSAATGFENYQNFSWGEENESNENHLSIVRRQANNSKDINNNLLNTHFQQLSAVYQHSTELDEIDILSLLNHSKIDNWIFASKGTDIGRSNIRFPNRIVNIPDESHQIIKSAISSPNQWSIDFFLHNQSLTTQTIRPNRSIIDVSNQSKDFGVNWQKGWSDNKPIASQSSSNLLGIDFYSRRNVNSEESNLNLVENIRVDTQTLVNASRDELAAFYSHHSQINKWRFQAGGRLTSARSQNSFSISQSNTALTAFAGVAYNVFGQEDTHHSFEVNANIGNAFRFPSLTELYFSGTTARGEIIGNENLIAEESINLELGFNWNTEFGYLKMTVFESNFDEYIERVKLGENTLGDDILTFVNQQNGTIKGLETEVQFDLSQTLELSFIATLIEGENKQREALADIPSDRASLSLNYHNNDWSAQITLQHRRTKMDFANGEQPTQSANLLSASYQYQLNQHWLFKVVGENLLDVEYVGSADDLATLMPGRTFGFNVVWSND